MHNGPDIDAACIYCRSQDLSEDELMQVLTQPRNALIKQYAQMLAYSNARLVVTDGARRAVAARARSKGTGTRSLRSILEVLLQDAMYAVPELPESEQPAVVLLDEEGVVNGTGGQCILYQQHATCECNV